MIKKAVSVIGLLVIGLLIVGASAIRTLAEEDVLGAQTISVNQQTDVKKALLEQENNYYLSYPGILPDHPIYWLKMVRDKAAEIMTTDQMKKIDLWMTFADKRLGAAKVLIEGNKVELGVQTATKSLGYLAKSVEAVEKAKSGGTNVGDLANRMERETLKHAQVLGNLAQSGSGDVAGKLNGLSDEALKLHDRVEIVLGRTR